MHGHQSFNGNIETHLHTLSWFYGYTLETCQLLQGSRNACTWGRYIHLRNLRYAPWRVVCQCHRHGSTRFLIGDNLQIAIFHLSIIKSETKRIEDIICHIFIGATFHGIIFKVGQEFTICRESNGQLTREVCIPEYQVTKCITSFLSWIPSHDDGICHLWYFPYINRTSSRQHHDDATLLERIDVAQELHLTLWQTDSITVTTFGVNGFAFLSFQITVVSHHYDSIVCSSCFIYRPINLIARRRTFQHARTIVNCRSVAYFRHDSLQIGTITVWNAKVVAHQPKCVSSTSTRYEQCLDVFLQRQHAIVFQ